METLIRILPIIPLITAVIIITIRQKRHERWQDKHDKMMSDIYKRRVEMDELMFKQKYGHGIDEFDKY